jgi:hypothetical protein
MSNNDNAARFGNIRHLFDANNFLLWLIVIGLIGLLWLLLSPKPTINAVPVSELPPEARPVDVGALGQVYRLDADGPVDVRFPAPRQATQDLLDDTVHLFVLDPTNGRWLEVEGSYYDARAGELVGQDLSPGLYTAFGWSANPAANAIQRMIADVQRGHLPEQPQASTLDELRQQVASTRPELRPGLVRDWVLWSFNLQRTTCETFAGEDCHPNCGRHRTKLRSCPAECPESAGCCECQTFNWPERLYVPVGFLEIAPVPCPGGPPCSVCPNGLSCPTGPFVDEQRIDPTFEVPRYDVFDRVGLEELVDDVVLRDTLHRVIEQTVDRQYPVPPPWP